MNCDLDEEFPLTKKMIYLNTAAVGVCPKSTIEVMENYIKDRCNWLKGGEGWRESVNKWLERVNESKRLFAKLIGSKESEVAFVPNTTTGINTVLSMMPLKSGENIVTTDLSYPMGAIACLKQRERGVKTRFVKNINGEVRIEDFEKAIDDNTSVVMVDQAGWYNGFLHDLKAISRIAHEHGAFLIVDAVQSVGGLKIDVKREGVDFLATSTYKWLLGGPYTLNAGYLYIDEEYIDSFQPLFVGNQTIDKEPLKTNIYDRFDLYDLKYRRGIERFQIYPRNELAYVAVENSMRILLNHGINKIEEYIKKLGTLLINGLLESGFKLQTPVEEDKRLYVNVKVKNNRELEKKFYENNIVVSARIGGIRVSPHFYNREEEIEIFLSKLKEFTATL